MSRDRRLRCARPRRGGRAAEDPRPRCDAAARPSSRRSKTSSIPPTCRRSMARRIYAGHRPRADAAAVAMVRRAGGIDPRQDGDHRIRLAGARRHPQSAETSRIRRAARLRVPPPRSPPRMLPIALGSQTAGSVIRPAAFCGIVGFKPSYRLIPTVGMKCFAWHLDTVGLFAAGVADVAFAAAAITGRDLRVDRSAPAAPRIGARAHASVAAGERRDASGVETAARAAASGRCDGDRADAAADPGGGLPARTVRFRTTKRFARSPSNTTAIATSSQSRCASSSTAPRRSPPTNMTRRAAPPRARVRQCRICMREYDVILTPSAPGAAPHGLGSTGNPVFNRLWTLLGTPASTCRD